MLAARGDEVQRRVAGGRGRPDWLAERGGTLREALPDRADGGLVPDERRAGARLARRVVGLVGEVGMQHQRLARVGEEAVVAGVEVALRRQALGEQDGVGVELDVEILDRGPGLLLVDGRAVDELAGADQLAIDEDGVIRRDQQIGVRHVVGEGAAPDADGATVSGCGCAVRSMPAAAEPLHRLGGRVRRWPG